MTDGRAAFDLVETMLFDPETGLPLLEHHIARVETSAAELGFAFDRHALRNELQAATFRVSVKSRVRMLLGPAGSLAVEVRPTHGWTSALVQVALVPRRAPADDPRLRHKTTDRSIYDMARASGETEEVLLIDEQGYLTEGSFTSIFVEVDEKLVTPPRTRGLVPGVLRQKLLEEGHAVEGDIRPADLRGNLFIGNALRGLVAATPVEPPAQPR